MQIPNLIVRHSGIVTLKKIVDANDGILCIGEVAREIPFAIKRFYFITNLQHTISERGKHAHRELSQVIFCVNGTFTLSVDDGENTQDIQMEAVEHIARGDEAVGIILGPRLWHTMHDFSNDCALLVVASDIYRESDYIRNYDDFLTFLKEQK